MPHTIPIQDDEFHELRRQLENALPFLPPAMREEFGARVLGAAALAHAAVAVVHHRERSSPELTLHDLRREVDAWRADAARIRRIFR